MPETRKNHLDIDGGQVKDNDEHVASYKPIPDSDTGFRTSKSNLSKSKEKVSADGAEEKLLQKEDEAKIVTRVDMADAKYVVEDHRNGDAKIELDANKRQFTGLTKEELLKYADDPFWVNLRWFMFVLFWTAWLAMLAGAIAIIIRAPKCARPTPKTWYESPLVEYEGSCEELKSNIDLLKEAKVKGVFMSAPTYDVLDDPALIENYKKCLDAIHEDGIKVIVDLIPNYVSKDHVWFKLSENKTAPYTEYFTWREGKFENGNKVQPNNWRAQSSEEAWTLNEKRNEYYLNLQGSGKPDLNFYNTEVEAKFDEVLLKWLKAGVDGVRLNKARDLLVDQSFADEKMASDRRRSGLGIADRDFWEHKRTSDQPKLITLLAKWSDLVDKNSTNPGNGETAFTLKEEDPDRMELYRIDRNLTFRPPSLAPLLIDENVEKAASYLINTRLKDGRWPAIKLTPSEDASAHELVPFAMLLPAAPIFTLDQIKDNNETSTTESLSHLAGFRDDASLAHGHYLVTSVSSQNSTKPNLIACARWKAGHTGFVAVYNPTAEDVRANLTSVTDLPEVLTVHYMTHDVKMATNYTNNYSEETDNVLVPAHSSIVLSYVPKTEVEQ